ncbi:hypothetical protein GCM10009841_08700 [Microlunatus panaciterrae]|uniref:Neutral metalloproteinase n=1 Tax=Microlunatus panaciterrae TaxID=400768 RepID=A0ABS2RK85_9ACTN|nr:protealysin inhibitor emfourin [Microlunatus panaciterrae]MBM7799416.1 hypothetical protein [Microlunatus panaciterrae]
MACQFIPPYLLSRIAAVADDEDLCACGRRTLLVDDRLRAGRTTPPATLRHPAVRTAAGNIASATRVVHSANNTEQLPGDPVRGDGDPPSGDPAVDEAFDAAGQIWDLFANQFKRVSVDGKGTPLSITVHYGENYDNAFWDGHQLVFGDGDGKIFGRFTRPMDVMAHEFTHGVTQFTAALTYQGQSGALNESVSDAFAAMAEQRSLGQSADQADWLIGKGLFLPGVKAKGLRSMKEPGTAYDDPRLGKDPQVASMDDYIDTEDDNGGVHLNSGIPNRAFYLACTGLGGNSWERPGRIWYEALTAGDVDAGTDFAGFAEATVAAAGRLFADDPDAAARVRAAWVEVKVLDRSGPLPATPPTDAAGPAKVAVRRSGGFAGMVRSAEVDLTSDPVGPELQSLLSRLDLPSFTAGPPAPDRFVYTVEYGEQRTTVGEADLTPELSQVVRLVLGDL